MTDHSACEHLYYPCEAAVRPADSTHRWGEGEQGEYDSLKAKGRRAYDALRWFDGKSHQEAFALALEAHGRSSTFLHRRELIASYRSDVERVHPEFSPSYVDELVEAYGRLL